MRRFLNVGILLTAICLLLPTWAAAQETTGSISGTVVKSGGEGLAGAKVTVMSDRGTREVTTDGQGRFLLAFLSPGGYDLTVSAEGFQTIKDEGVSVGLGQRISRRYSMTPVLEESVEVTAPEELPPPVIDLTVQQTGASIPTEVAEQLPLARNISSIVFLAPGVKSGGGTGSANPSISGSSGLENQYVFDGVNVTNAGYGALGAYSIIHGSQGTGINFNFVEETQVLTGGFSAEYGQAMGGIVNVKTKSGTNEWEGSIYGFYQPDGLEATRRTPQLDSIDIGPTLGFERLDYGADIGGPIVKDHVFFWMGINPIRATTTRRAPWADRLSPDGDGDGFEDEVPDGVPDYLLYNEGALDYETDTVSWAGKFTFQINPNHAIDLSAFGTPTDTNNTFTRGSSTLIQDDYSQFSSLKYEDNAYSLKYQGQVTPNFLIDAQIARAENTFEENFAPQFDANRLSNVVPLQTGTGPTTITGGIGFFETNETVRDSYQAKFTNIIGNHELKYGFTVEDVEYNAATDRTGPGYTNRNGEASTTGVSYQRRVDCTIDPTDPRVTETVQASCADPIIDGGVRRTRNAAVIYRVTRGLLSDPVKNTTSDYTALFIQDDWAITPNFHLNFGVRYEEQTVSGELVSYDFPGEFSPRVGFSWDHAGDGSSKLYGHAGRFYEKLPQDMAVRIFSPERGVSRDDHFDANLTQPVPQGTGTGTRYIEQTSAVDDVVPGTRNSYTDEFVLGYQHLLGKQERWKLKGEVTYRTLGRILEDFDVSVDQATCDALVAGTLTIDGWSDIPGILRPGSDQVFTDAFGDPYAVDCGYLLANIQAADIDGVISDGEFVKPKREYKALVVELSRQADEHWYFMVQYALSRLEGNYEGLFRNDNGQSDPNLTALYDFANEPAFYETYASGPLNTDRTHRLQAFGYYNWDNGWFVNSRAVIQSGVPKLSLASHPIYENGGEVSLSRRGSEGRTSTEWGMDLGWGKRFKLATAYESDITLSMDIFNVFNHTYGTGYEFDVDNGTNLAYDDYATFVQSVAEGVPNTDHFKATSYNAPRQFRFGVKWSF